MLCKLLLNEKSSTPLLGWDLRLKKLIVNYKK